MSVYERKGLETRRGGKNRGDEALGSKWTLLALQMEGRDKTSNEAAPGSL